MASSTASRRRPAAPAPAQEALDEPAARVLRQFRVVFNAVRTHFRAVEKQAGVAGAQLWALSVAGQRPGLGVSELARAMDIHQSTASNLLKPLLARGLLAAERSATDRRAVHLKVTAAGQRVLRKAPGPFTGVLPEALARLDQRTLARLERDLGRVVELLGAQDGADVPLGTP